MVPPGRTRCDGLVHASSGSRRRRARCRSRTPIDVPAPSRSPASCSVGVTGQQVDVGADRPGGGDGAQPDGPGPDDQHPWPRLHAGPIDAVEGDRHGLDQAGHARGRAWRERPWRNAGSTHTSSASPPSRLIPYMESKGGRALLLVRRPGSGRTVPHAHRRAGRPPACRRRAGRRTRGPGSPSTARTRPGAGPTRRSPSWPPTPARPSVRASVTSTTRIPSSVFLTPRTD